MTQFPIRVVLDTNVLVSALRFSRGKLQWLRQAWQVQQVLPLVSSDTVLELVRVLAYPKFALSSDEQQTLLAEYLPHAQAVKLPRKAPPDLPECRDACDQKFINLAVASKAVYLVTGDRDLLEMAAALKPLGVQAVQPPALRSALVLG